MSRSKNSFGTAWRMAVLSALLVAGAGVAYAAPVVDLTAAPENPGQSHAYGRSLGEWMEAYWSWALGGPAAGYPQPVVFLPLPAGMPSDEDPSIFVGELDLTLRVGEPFVLPMFVFIGETYLEDAVPDDDATAFPSTIFTEARVLIELDGKPIIDSMQDDLNNHYFDTQYFDAPIFYGAPVEYAPDVHAIGAIWLKGIGFVHPPLPAGHHTLELFVYTSLFGVGFDNTWNITVLPRGMGHGVAVRGWANYAIDPQPVPPSTPDEGDALPDRTLPM